MQLVLLFALLIAAVSSTQLCGLFAIAVCTIGIVACIADDSSLQPASVLTIYYSCSCDFFVACTGNGSSLNHATVSTIVAAHVIGIIVCADGSSLQHADISTVCCYLSTSCYSCYRGQ